MSINIGYLILNHSVFTMFFIFLKKKSKYYVTWQQINDNKEIISNKTLFPSYIRALKFLNELKQKKYIFINPSLEIK